MDEQVRQALEQGRLIDITTTGRHSGDSRRIEIVYSRVDGEVYITGIPGRRSWYANLLANPDFTFHLKEGVTADLAARATAITEPAERRALFTQILPRFGREADIEKWMTDSPLVRVAFTD